jgi:hypothetical protein
MTSMYAIMCMTQLSATSPGLGNRCLRPPLLLLLHALPLLLLPWSGADVGWAMALVKTRAHGDGSRLALMPLHEMINHSERGSANLTPAAASSTTAG